MPTYEYICTACQHEWEEEQSIKDEPLERCPSCKKKKARRQISRGTGFILKGGGWYSDLYASPSGAAKEGDAKAESSAAATSTSSAPAKPDGASDGAAKSESNATASTEGGGASKKKGAKKSASK
jgi:putative FmdB family regulatory protein